MATAPAPGSTVKITGGEHSGAAGTVTRVRVDALLEVRLPNGRTITVELYHVTKEN